MKTMTYRRYITIGMNKRKSGLLFFTGVLFIICSRILFFFFAGAGVEDTYGYFEQAMIRMEKTEPFFSSGLSYGFTHALSVALRFVGNRHFMAGLWQMTLQILWMILFLAGAGMLLGWAAGFAATVVLMVSPWVFNSVFVIAPENYFMLYASLFLVLLGYYAKTAWEKGWRENFPGRLYLAAAGILLGVLCTWNYLGLVLVVLSVYVQIENHRLWKGKTIDRERMMGTGIQCASLLVWVFVGILAGLMRYTALTGLSILQQLGWWGAYLTDFGKQGQEVSGLLSLWLITAWTAGIVYRRLRRKPVEPGEEEMTEEREETNEGTEVHQETDAGEEQEKVKFLENPLPVPKKHVKKEIAFDFDIEDAKMEFDISVSEKDDFDIS